MAIKVNNSYYRLPILYRLEFLHAKNHTAAFPFHSHSTFNITLILDQVFSIRLSNRLLQAPTETIVITNPRKSMLSRQFRVATPSAISYH